MKFLRVTLVSLLWVLAVAPRADVPVAADPLLPTDVLQASESHFPSILKALADRRAAEGRVTESLGAFDIVFSADGFDRAAGFYDGTALGGKVLKPLRPLGGQLYGGYSLSNGDFPIYEDENFTNNGGTAKLGVLFSLLRDRDIDARRFGQIDAELALRQADLERLGIGRPGDGWLFVACDMPGVTRDAIGWLLERICRSRCGNGISTPISRSLASMA